MPNLEHALEKRIQSLSMRIDRLERVNRRFSNIRLAAVLVGIPAVLACFRYAGNLPGWIALAAVVTGFCLVLRCHGRVEAGIAGHRARARWKSAQLARIRLDWERIPPVPPMSVDADHAFGIDLDIAGERSLHRLMDSTITLAGSKRLLNRLLETAHDRELILKRQVLVKELSLRTLFRGRLISNALNAAGKPASRGSSRDLYGKLDAQSLLLWTQKRGTASSIATKAFVPLTLMATANLAVFGLLALRMIPVHFVNLYFVYIAVLLLLQIEIKKAFQDAVSMETTLNRLLPVFGRLESFGYAGAPNLRSLCEPFLNAENRPSAQLRRISRIVSGISVRSNPIVWLIVNSVFPWDIYFARRLEQSKDALSTLLPAWLDVLNEIEVLNSLAEFAFLNPDYCYPELNSTHIRERESASPPGRPSQSLSHDQTAERTAASMPFHAENLGHPLIPRRKRVCNDFSFDADSRIALITGSNMAGKSSFLRTIGVNLCLAYAGAPAAATNLRTSVCRVHACMRVDDSLTDGFSFFYAEVRRLKMVLTAVEDDAARLPVLFLLDEIFRGTNNRERFIGSRAYILALAEHATFGAIATHDLELVRLAEEAPSIANYHFREEVKDGRMIFDYQLRPGPCPTTNALKIMAMVGLPVAFA